MIGIGGCNDWPARAWPMGTGPRRHRSCVDTGSSMNIDRRTVLVVEDDPKLRSAMGRELRRMGLDVLEASHFDAAASHLAIAQVDLVCIDVGLPSKSGYELCEHIRNLPR